MNTNINILFISIILIIILISVILHELAHGITAYFLGDDTAKDAGRLSLNPIKHIDPFMSIITPVTLYILDAPVFGGAKPVPINSQNLKWREWGVALVAIAGPFTNLLLAFISFLIGHFTGSLYGVNGELSFFIFSKLIFTNLGFFIFNLIPIPPLDGSRVLYAVSPDKIREVFTRIESYGIIIVYVLIFLFSDFLAYLMSAGTSGILQLFYYLV